MHLNFFVVISFLFVNQIFAQKENSFHYEHSLEQKFRFRPGTSKTFFTINLDKENIIDNSLFEINSETTKIIIPSAGFYEVSGKFHFNLNTGNINYSRAGINFGFIQIVDKKETYIAATRFSYKKENQEGFQNVFIQPTIVYLEKGVVLAPAISVGLLDKVILNAVLACEEEDKKCTTFEWTIKKISNEVFKQQYF